jgi:hypothetical protein
MEGTYLKHWTLLLDEMRLADGAASAIRGSAMALSTAGSSGLTECKEALASTKLAFVARDQPCLDALMDHSAN